MQYCDQSLTHATRAAEAAAKAAALNKKLGIAEPTAEELRAQRETVAGGSAECICEELEVNDFPASVRCVTAVMHLPLFVFIALNIGAAGATASDS